jgi:hypothetical protein
MVDSHWLEKEAGSRVSWSRLSRIRRVTKASYDNRWKVIGNIGGGGQDVFRVTDGPRSS